MSISPRQHEKINVTRDYPGVPFLHTTESSISLLIIGVSRLSLQSVVEVYNDFLMNDALFGTSSMNTVRHTVNDYDKEIHLIIDFLKHNMMLALNIKRNESNDNSDQVNQTNIRKLFPRIGWFEGNIIINSKENNCNIYEIKFEDGDDDTCNQEEYNKYQSRQVFQLEKLVLDL